MYDQRLLSLAIPLVLQREQTGEAPQSSPTSLGLDKGASTVMQVLYQTNIIHILAYVLSDPLAAIRGRIPHQQQATASVIALAHWPPFGGPYEFEQINYISTS